MQCHVTDLLLNNQGCMWIFGQPKCVWTFYVIMTWKITTGDMSRAFVRQTTTKAATQIWPRFLYFFLQAITTVFRSVQWWTPIRVRSQIIGREYFSSQKYCSSAKILKRNDRDFSRANRSLAVRYFHQLL